MKTSKAYYKRKKAIGKQETIYLFIVLTSAAELKINSNHKEFSSKLIFSTWCFIGFPFLYFPRHEFCLQAIFPAINIHESFERNTLYACASVPQINVNEVLCCHCTQISIYTNNILLWKAWFIIGECIKAAVQLRLKAIFTSHMFSITEEWSLHFFSHTWLKHTTLPEASEPRAQLSRAFITVLVFAYLFV